MDIKVNLGCGTDIIPGWDNVDMGFNPNFLEQPSWTVKADVLDYLRALPDGCVSEVKAHHILEHVADLDAVMHELARVCKSGTRLNIIVPLGNTLWSVADPTHRREFNHRTFQYYCGDFKTCYDRERNFKLITQNIEREPNEWFGGIEWIVANLHVILERI